MEFFRIKKDIPFMKHALIFNAISFITFALAVFFLFTRGLHLSVEFTGGTVMEVAYSQPAELAKVRETVSGLGYTDDKPLVDYLNMVMRLQKAKALIERGLPIVQVAINSGFADQSHLTRHFKSCFGTTPKVWAKLNQ